MLYECKVESNLLCDEGIKRVTKVYLVDAMSFSEAEARIVKEMSSLGGSRNPEIKGIKEYKVSELFLGGGSGIYYKARILVSEVCEGTGKIKKVPLQVLVELSSPTGVEGVQALDNILMLIKDNMSSMLYDWSVVRVEQTPIVGIFHYED